MKEFLINNKKNILLTAIIVVILASICLMTIMSTGMTQSAFAYTVVEGSDTADYLNMDYWDDRDALIIAENDTDVAGLKTLYENYNSTRNGSNVSISLYGSVKSEFNGLATGSDYDARRYFKQFGGNELVRLYSVHEDITLMDSLGHYITNDLTRGYYIDDELRDYVKSYYGAEESTVGDYVAVFYLAFVTESGVADFVSETFEVIDFSVSADDLGLEVDPVAPKLPGYDFVGWYYDADFTEPYIAGTVINEDTDLHAKYEESIYTITIFAVKWTKDLNGNSGYTEVEMDSIECTYFDELLYVNIPAPIIEDYAFDKVSSCCNNRGDQFDFLDGLKVRGDATVYLHYDLITYNVVSLYVNGNLYETLNVPFGGWLTGTTILRNDEDFDVAIDNLAPLYSDYTMETEVADIETEEIVSNVNYFSAEVNVDDTGDNDTDDNDNDNDDDKDDESDPGKEETRNFLEENKVLFGILGGLVLLSIVFSVINGVLSHKKKR